LLVSLPFALILRLRSSAQPDLILSFPLLLCRSFVFFSFSIIEPITSRCAKFRFKSLNSDSMIGRLRTIADAEHLSLQEDTLHKLVELSEGDMRRSITIMQSAQKLRGKKNQLRPEDVMEVAGVRSKHNSALRSVTPLCLRCHLFCLPSHTPCS